MSAMKAFNKAPMLDYNWREIPKDFHAVELSALKDIFLNFEKALNAIVIKTSFNEGTYFEGIYIFELLAKAGITDTNLVSIRTLIDKIVQFLTTVDEGPIGRKGAGLQLFAWLLRARLRSLGKTSASNIKCTLVMRRAHLTQLLKTKF